MLEEISKRIAEYLGVDVLPIEYDNNIVDDNRLVTEGKSKIIINQKYKKNYLETVKSITHEYRHVFQLYWVILMPNDELAKLWKEELIKAKTGNEKGYNLQTFELDAFAFTQVFLAREGVKIKHPNIKYQELIYIKRYKRFL
ncbi:MAG: hypothetical protein PHX46_02630 [Bacilli bacterium]|nr:hypothetical protein [Bacilli bacterium]